MPDKNKNPLKGLLIEGFGGGGGGSSRTPREAKDNLFSKESARILDLISEGEIKGLVNGHKSIFLDDTPLQSPSGRYNFENVIVETRAGTQNQTPIPNFPDTENELAVNVEVKHGQPVTRQFSNENLTSLIVRVSTPRLFQQDARSGDTNGYNLPFNIELQTDNGIFRVVHNDSFNGKTSAKYSRSIEINLPRGAHSWAIRVNKLITDSTTTRIQSQLFVDAITEVVDANLSYPNSALIGINVLAEQFPQIPRRGYEVYGIKVKIPSNYNPYNRTYSGAWNGSFKVDWTDNPAWIFHALATHPLYGLGQRIKEQDLDKWGLYQIAQYCDQMVPNGRGGQEPRFTINTYLQNKEQAYELLQNIASVFRGMAYYAAGSVFATSDRPALEKPFIFSPSNVVEGKFNYEGSPKSNRYSVAVVGWNDPTDMYRQKYEYVEDRAALNRYGYAPTEFNAFGCTSQGQAHRAGKWALLTSNLETQVVTFKVSLEAMKVIPGSICAIQDPSKSNMKGVSGRISSATTTTVTVDRDLNSEISAGHKIFVTMPSGVTEERTISNVESRKLTVSQPFSTIPQAESQWAIETRIKLQLFRVLSVTDSGDSQFEIRATEHDPRKYDSIESNVVLEDRPTVNWGKHGAAPSEPTDLDIRAVTQGIEGSASVLVGEISWSSDVARHTVRYRRSNGGWITQNVVGTSLEIPNFKFGTYQVEVTAINIQGMKSGTTTLTKSVTGVEFSLRTPPNLRLEGAYTSSWLKVVWGSVPGATGYTVRISALGVVRRTVQVGNTLRFDYSAADMRDDLGPWREVTVEVMATGPFDAKSDWANLSVSNPQIGPLQGIQVEPNTRSILMTANKPTEEDLAGYLYWISDDPNFTPTASNATHDVNFNQIFFELFKREPLENKDYYVWAAGYDTFGKDSLNISSSYKVKPLVLKLDQNSIIEDMIADGAFTITKFADNIKPPVVVDEFPENPKEYDRVVLTSDGKTYQYINGEWSSRVSVDDLEGRIEAPQLSPELNDVIDLISGDGLGSVNERLKEVKEGLQEEVTSVMDSVRDVVSDLGDLDTSTNTKIDSVRTDLTDEIGTVRTTLVETKEALSKDIREEVEDRKTQIESLETSLSEDISAAITSEATARSKADEALTLQIREAVSEVNTDIGSLESRISTEELTRSSETEALAGRADKLETSLSTLESDTSAAITAESTARSKADSALVNQITALETSVDKDIAAAITAESTARSKADSAISTTLSSHISEYKSNKSSVDSKLTTLSNADSATTEALNNHISEYGSNKASVNSQITTLTNAQSSQAQAHNSLKAEFDNQEIGGRNLLRNTHKPSTFAPWSTSTLTEISDDVGNLGIRVEAKGNSTIGFRPVWGSKLVQGRQYTLSFYVASSKPRLSYCYIMRPSGGNASISGIDVTNKLTKVTVKLTPPWSTDKGSILLGTSGAVKGDWIEVYGLQLEEGNVATAWSLNPDDISEEFSNISAEISSTNTVIANNHQVLTNQLTKHISDYGSNKASVDSSLTTLSKADSAITQRLDTHVSEYNSNKASVNSSLTTLSKADSTTTQALNKHINEYDSNKATVNSKITTLTNAQSAQAQEHNTLKAEFNSQEIGGRNLLHGTNDIRSLVRWGASQGNLTYYDHRRGQEAVRVNITGTGSIGVFSARKTKIVAGTEYIITFYGQATFNELSYCHLLSSSQGNFRLPSIAIRSGDTGKRSLTFTAPWTSDDVGLLIAATGRSSGDWFTVAQLQLEKGNVATEWTPNPDDFSESLGGISAEIAATNTVVANNKQAATQALNTHISNYNSNKTAVQNQITTLSTADSAISKNVTTLSSTVGNHTTKITSHSSSIDGLEGQVFQKINNNGYITGWGLASTTKNGTPTSAFKILSNALVLGDPKTPDVNPFRVETNGSNSRLVLDGNIIATGSVTANALGANSITAGKIAAGAVGANQISAGAVTASKMTISNMSNLFLDSEFNESYAHWTKVGTGIEKNGTGAQHGTYYDNTIIKVQPGDVYLFSAKVTRVSGAAWGGTGGVTLHLQRRTSSGWSYLTAGVRVASSQSGTIVTGSPVTIPAGTTAIRLGFYTESNVPSSNRVRIEDVFVRQMMVGELIVDGSIKTQHITANSIQGDRIAANTLNGDKVIANTLHGNRIIANTITADRLAANTITAASGKIANAAITTAKIADLAVTAAKIANANITNAKIANAAITSAKIGDLQVQRLKIANNSVTTMSHVAVTRTNHQNWSMSLPAGRYIFFYTFRSGSYNSDHYNLYINGVKLTSFSRGGDWQYPTYNWTGVGKQFHVANSSGNITIAVTKSGNRHHEPGATLDMTYITMYK